ncbi:hypothetical protein HU200_029850 [Digitaria exilis]|uniref:Uncharacterized protein n=1 Tax=Digitaria exilis TaxID=1010633 RepID=A0A835C3A6_9POAL|nr:hypothetical protein HU200_029850 [Digitaria exilis]
MGKKAPPKGELEKNLRKSKSPRLDLLASVAAAVAPEASDLIELDAAETSGNNRCDHILTDVDRRRLGVSLLSKKAGTCVGCRREDAEGPQRGYCFNCNAEVEMPVEFEVDGHVIGIDVIRDVVSWLPDTQDRLRARMIVLRTHPQFLANEQSNFEKMQTLAESDDSHLGSESKEVIVEATPKPLEVGMYLRENRSFKSTAESAKAKEAPEQNKKQEYRNSD